MKYLLAACFWLSTSLVLAEGPTLKEARLRFLKGNYAEALTKYTTLARDPQTQVAATIGLSRAHQSTGDHDKALMVVEALLKDKPRDAGLLARKAEVLYLRGRWDEALKTAEAALKEQAENLAARWVRAQVWRDQGEIKKADAEFRWFVNTFSARSAKDDDITDPDELLIVGRAATENARWHNLADQYQTILDDVYGDALKQDKDYWLAECQAGLLLLEKYSQPKALAAFDKALTINPGAAEALVGKGLVALQKLEIKDAENFANRALKSNPRLPAALRLKADVHLATGNAADALKTLDDARKVNPRDERTLGRVAICLKLLGRQKEFDDLEKEVRKHNPTPGAFHLTLGRALEDRRRYAEAEKHYLLVRKLRPMLNDATTHLGLLCMRLGREKEGEELLRKSFKADDFNVRVSNTLKVIDHLQKYQTLKTEHFELRYDAKHDAPLARYLAEYLEQVYADLAAQFDHRPKERILVEVFTNHEMFSGRTVALPDLHTIGACTGRMFCMVSPRGWRLASQVGDPKKGRVKVFNWARVIRHELVHIFNLDQTNFLVPHWLTEGLAVENEGFPRPPSWNELLRRRVPVGELMNLDTIDLGFIRPRSPQDWSMAYCQSQLYVQYLKEKYKEEAIAGLLNAYRDGLDTASAIKKVCKVDKAEFEKGYRAHLDAVVKTIKGRSSTKPMTLNELRTAHQKDPNNADVAAGLAEKYLRSNRGEARKLAQKVHEKNPKHPLASFVLARLESLAGNTEKAQALLEAAVNEKDPDPKVVLTLGKMYYEAGELKKAAKMFELGRRAEPYENEWLLQLARVYARAEDRDKQIEVLRALVPTDPDDIDHRKRLARLLADKGDYATAERYARQALEIDVSDAEAQRSLFRSLEGQKKKDEADRLRKLLGK